jgi:hypothetical protein
MHEKAAQTNLRGLRLFRFSGFVLSLLNLVLLATGDWRLVTGPDELSSFTTGF